MKLIFIPLIALILPFFASAQQLTYKIDLKQSNMDESTAFDLCVLPKEIKMDAKEDLATVVINKTYSSSYKQKIQFIESTTGGSISGGDLKEPYMGDYRIRVALLNLAIPSYPGGVYYRVEITTFGSKQAPKAFTVSNEALNYQGSAELAEDSACTGYAYRLQ